MQERKEETTASVSTGGMFAEQQLILKKLRNCCLDFDYLSFKKLIKDKDTDVTLSALESFMKQDGHTDDDITDYAARFKQMGNLLAYEATVIDRLSYYCAQNNQDEIAGILVEHVNFLTSIRTLLTEKTKNLYLKEARPFMEAYNTAERNVVRRQYDQQKAETSNKSMSLTTSPK